MKAGEIIAERYRLHRPLATGGMASLWLAEHVVLKSPVAIKFLQREMADDERDLQRFLHEARATARLRSPHIVRVFDSGLESGRPFIAMEYLQGATLAQLLEARGRLSEDECRKLAAQLVRGLNVAHAENLIHRDLKPANLMLAEEAGERTWKILDFGIAQSANPAVQAPGVTTGTGVVLGSPAYMSPEQARAQRLDVRADLWALAVVLYEALTGQRPFSGANAADLLLNICAGDAPCPSSILAGAPPSLDDFFRKAFARTAGARFSSATDLGQAFGLALDGHSSRELVPGRTESTQRVASAERESNPRLNTAGWLAVALVALSAGAWLVWPRSRIPLESTASPSALPSAAALAATGAPSPSAEVSRMALPAEPQPAPSAQTATPPRAGRATVRRPPPSASALADTPAKPSAPDPIFGLPVPR